MNRIQFARSVLLALLIFSGSAPIGACGGGGTPAVLIGDPGGGTPVVPPVPEDPQTATLYVAPTGDDGNVGSLASPLKTLAAARDKVRTLRGTPGDILISFRGGRYLIDETVVLGPGDGGFAGQSVTYAAYPGETPVFTSLVPVTGSARGVPRKNRPAPRIAPSGRGVKCCLPVYHT